MKTFCVNTLGINSVSELFLVNRAPIIRSIKKTWFEGKDNLKIEIGQYHEIDEKSCICQFTASKTSDEVVPSFVTALVNLGDSKLAFFFEAIDIVCPSLAGMYETIIMDDYPKIGFWVDCARPSFDCWFTNENKKEMVIQTNLFLMPEDGRPYDPVKKSLKNFTIFGGSGDTDWWSL